MTQAQGSLPLHLLVVDDSVADLLLITAAFEDYPNVRLTTHAQATGALAWLETRAATGSAPDLVVLDLHMPGVDGLAWLQLLHQRPTLRDIPVLLYSLTPVDRQLGQITSPQVCGCWQKPVTFTGMQQHAQHLYDIWEREQVFTPSTLQASPQ